MKRRIAILMHERQRSIKRNYMVHTYAAFWQQDGHEVVTVFGVSEWIPADVVIVHVDLSVVPEEYLEFAARYPVALNGKVRDIRKSAISRQLLAAGDRYDGAVIVKSDLNYAGLPERTLGLAQSAPFRHPSEYPIFPSLSALPPVVWTTPGLVVEKFLPELEDGLYHMRAMLFLGDRISCTRMASRKPIVNGTTQVQVEDIEPDAEMIALKQELGFDYGKFDYVVHQGRPMLIDTNKTVGGPPKTDDPKVVAGRQYRAQGLYAFFPP